MSDITESFLALLVKLLELSADLRNTRLDQIIAAQARIEKRQLFEVEALKALLRGQPNEATIAALTQNLNAEADKLGAAVAAQTPPVS
jgi:hypothetical protein